MSTVKTIFGEISPGSLGFVDIHAHIWKEGGMEVVEDRDFAIDDLVKSRTELEYFKSAGGNTLVDMQPLGLGRSIERMREVAKGTGVNVVAVTGFHKGAFYDTTHFTHRYEQDQIEELVVSEVIEGIEINDFCGPIVQRSEAKAGVIKAGSSYYKITPFEKKLISISARAAKKTNAPVMTHTQIGTMGLEQVQLIKGEGVDPSKICIGHLDRNADPVYHEMVLREGVYVQYDCVARVKYHPVSDTVDIIKLMVKRGYADKILIGSDWGRASYLRAYNGSPGLEFIPGTFSKLMLEYGITEDVIHKIFYENPARFLAF